MKKILVPTDFSPTASSALILALDLASRAGASVILYHNYTPVESAFVGTEQMRVKHNGHNEEVILKRLDRLVKKYAAESRLVDVSTVVGHAPLVDNLLTFAKEHQVDLVIMGTEGAGGLKRFVLGSVAARVIGAAELPVLLVPARYEQSEIQRFVFLSDCHTNDTQVLNFLYKFTAFYQADLAVVHVMDLLNTEQEKSQARKDFDHYVSFHQRQPHTAEYKIHLLETPVVEDTFRSLADVYPYDVLVMLSHKKNWLQKHFGYSHRKEMAYQTKRPLLVYPGTG